jgi:hypothetical protein
VLPRARSMTEARNRVLPLAQEVLPRVLELPAQARAAGPAPPPEIRKNHRTQLDRPQACREERHEQA